MVLVIPKENDQVFKVSIKFAAAMNDRVLTLYVSSFLNLKYLFPSVLQISRLIFKMKKLVQNEISFQQYSGNLNLPLLKESIAEANSESFRKSILPSLD